jgi:hypothetical protein
MRHSKITTGAIAVLALALLAAATVTLAQGGYDLSWWTGDGGGGVSRGGRYALSGTIGQPDAGAMVGGQYALSGGFWAGVAAAYHVYLPTVLRSY